MPMPYTLTRGPLLTLLENLLNPAGPPQAATRDAALGALRDGSALADIPWVVSAPVAAVPIPRAPLDVRLNEDWFGMDDAPGKPTTGYWVGYKGDVEPVLREGLIRAIEVSLGIAHGEQPAAATRAWPVEVSWKCPNPYFEVWVTWRRHKQGGQVTMLIATPPDKVNRLVTEPRLPPAPAGASPVPTPLVEPTTATDVQGMWLVTHEHHVPSVQNLRVEGGANVTEVVEVTAGERDRIPLLPQDLWDIPVPMTSWTDTGPVVVVAPPPYAGGASLPHTNAPSP